MKVLSTKSERASLLADVAAAQIDYWDALCQLELAYGEDAVIDDYDDWLNDTTIEMIDEDMRASGFHVGRAISAGI